MLSRSELEGYTTALNFNIWQAERDYLQHLFLLFLSHHIRDELVFKGGTALQKFYGLNRFSIDLDFTLGAVADIDGILDKVEGDLESFGAPTEIKRTSTNVSETANFRIKGPLYDGSEKTLAVLRIEASTREGTLLPVIEETTPMYRDIPPYFLPVMQPQEILAEKVRAVMTRQKARDVYDLWFLLKKKTKVNRKLIDGKLAYCGKRFTKKGLREGVAAVSEIWAPELGPLLTPVPNFEDAKNFIYSCLMSDMLIGKELPEKDV